MSLNILAQYLSGINDTRQSDKTLYSLSDVLFLAVIAGCEGWEEIEGFGKARIDWLKNYGTYENGIPAHDTIAYVVSQIDPDVLHERFIKSSRSLLLMAKHCAARINPETGNPPFT